MKLAFIDKDWTLVKPKSGGTFVQSPDDQDLLPGGSERLTELEDADYKPVIISNQRGVQRGYKTLQNAVDEMRYALELTQIERGYFCPDEGCTLVCVLHPNSLEEANGGFWTQFEERPIFRKPDTGMLYLAKIDLKADCNMSDCLFIGDMESDRECANNAKIPYLHVDDWLREGLKSLSIGY